MALIENSVGEPGVGSDIAARAEAAARAGQYENANGVVKTNGSERVEDLRAHPRRVGAEAVRTVDGDAGDALLHGVEARVHVVAHELKQSAARLPILMMRFRPILDCSYPVLG